MDKTISPYLMPWSELPDDMKEWERETVRKKSFLLMQGWMFKESYNGK